MKTAVVFGSTGLIGGHLVNQLIQDNYYKLQLIMKKLRLLILILII